jgi:hypothetical protein
MMRGIGWNTVRWIGVFHLACLAVCGCSPVITANVTAQRM